MWGIDILRSGGAGVAAGLSDVGINFYVLTFTAMLSALTGIVFGLVPAWQASKPDLDFRFEKRRPVERRGTQVIIVCAARWSLLKWRWA
ncbi:MAG: hypothetical protein WKF84_09630 [Pyrinomonadaceae bacterium]